MITGAPIHRSEQRMQAKLREERRAIRDRGGEIEVARDPLGTAWACSLVVAAAALVVVVLTGAAYGVSLLLGW